MFQRREDHLLEPSVYVGKNRLHHLFLPPRKEVVEAAFAEAGRLRQYRQARALESVLAERFR